MPPLPDNIGVLAVANCVFKTKDFARFARRAGLDDTALCEAVNRANRGLIDADLGHGVIKQRVPRQGQGRSGGYRTLIFYRLRGRVVFVGGFAKNAKDNVGEDELKQLRKLAVAFFGYTPAAVKKLVLIGEWIEVDCDDSEIP
jgi:hypothetical protein